MIKFLAYTCFIISLLAFALGTLGLFRFKNPYSRMHGVGIGDTLGVGFMGLGLLVLSPSWALRFKIILTLLFFWTINPAMSHLIAKAAIMYGANPGETDKTTEMREG